MQKLARCKSLRTALELKKYGAKLLRVEKDQQTQGCVFIFEADEQYRRALQIFERAMQYRFY